MIEVPGDKKEKWEEKYIFEEKKWLKFFKLKVSN